MLQSSHTLPSVPSTCLSHTSRPPLLASARDVADCVYYSTLFASVMQTAYNALPNTTTSCPVQPLVLAAALRVQRGDIAPSALQMQPDLFARGTAYANADLPASTLAFASMLFNRSYSRFFLSALHSIAFDIPLLCSPAEIRKPEKALASS